MSVKVITTDEYHADRHHEHAGTAADLYPETVENWKATCPTWHGHHWQMRLVPGSGTCLAPVNVVTG
ncbi:hypothetical protein [Nocardia noduli]|uniref:hypothetical protein n=1 Tax=Nocardia noduli TaxID=2815722 RepID=UPI001C24462F|nr:hypothetical protein [Nocardia noduli]